MSVFTELLTQLAQYSAAVDACTVSHSDFIEFQRLEARIINAHNNGYINHTQKQALYNIAQGLHSDFRMILGLDR